jgi:hypothetical protein
MTETIPIKKRVGLPPAWRVHPHAQTGDCYVYFTEPPQRSLRCCYLRSSDGGRHVLHHLLNRRLRGGAMITSPHTDADRVEANNRLADMAEPIHDMWGLIRTSHGDIQVKGVVLG